MYATLISGDRLRTGDELADRVDRLVGGFSALGLRAGDVIAVLMRNDFAFIEISLAAERAGIPLVPLNWHTNSQELEYILRDCDAKARFAHADLLRRLRSIIPAGCTTVTADVPPELRYAHGVEEQDCAVAADDLDYEAWLPAVSSPGGFRTPALRARGSIRHEGRHPKPFTEADSCRAAKEASFVHVLARAKTLVAW